MGAPGEAEDIGGPGEGQPPCRLSYPSQCTVYGSLSVNGATFASNVSPAFVTIW
jgi:hypothetical protein